MKDKVNLDQSKTVQARGSRDWLKEKIHTFEGNEGFPKVYTDIDTYFGSFSRKTKIRELDDIDIMIGLNAQGSTYIESCGKIELTVPETALDLLRLCHDDTNKLNSRKVINKFVSNLKNIAQYENAEINRRSEAATLKLLSYPWNFDIVPCFFSKPEINGKTYYCIPDGEGNWKKTDPRIDGQRISRINQSLDGNVLNVIRAIKYWNRRPTMPSMGSYSLECLILEYYETKGSCSKWIDMEVKALLGHLAGAIYRPIYDPKNIQGDLNILPYAEKLKISRRARTDYETAVAARNKEEAGDQKAAINKWKEIFGSEFPSYTG
ncbi:hypothetical protein [Trichococcus shcherbakoviae]|uniref:hypothetical protein n=1 Tax=Trichococcus shcherbakoviae TaxID=2094020 RepID=UPI0029F541D2|nr:hypothetical protein [Trichococcus shcherbakoviae]